MKKYVIANLKMNMNLKEMATYLKTINKKIDDKKVIMCPTSIYIPYFLRQGYSAGLQNVYYGESGAFTGEISPYQAASIGVKYIIVGHSERRAMGENNDLINNKVKSCLAAGLKVILCVGESLEEKENFRTSRTLKKQLTLALKDIEKEDLKNILIAYEPVWAISSSGTNMHPLKKDIMQIAVFIKELIKNNYDYDKIKVLYGGSVTDKNINTLNRINEIDGFLVGGASLDTEKFLNIIEVVASQ